MAESVWCKMSDLKREIAICENVLNLEGVDGPAAISTGAYLTDTFRQTFNANRVKELLLEIESLRAFADGAKKVIEFYSSDDAMMAPLRRRYLSMPKCLEGNSEYFQDPSDLPIVKDGGERAKNFQASSIWAAVFSKGGEK